MRRRGSLGAVLALVATWLWSAPAHAGVDAEVVEGVLSVTGGSGNDVIRIACSGGDVVVNDANPGTGRATCSSIARIVVRGSGGSDVVDLRQVLPEDFTSLTRTRVVGGAGYETLYGSPLDDTLEGGDGNDHLWASGGTDRLDAGGGDDELRVETPGGLTLTDDELRWPEGTSALVAFEQATIRSYGRGVRLDLRGFRGRTYAYGAEGPDVLLGGPGVSGLFGGPGGDRLVGGEGGDYLSGGDGADVLRGGAGGDRMDGGRGRDDCAGGPGVDLIAGCP